jgi:hypothetical protein
MDRRDFLRSSVVAGGALLVWPTRDAVAGDPAREFGQPAAAEQVAGREPLPDLAPANQTWPC